MTARKEPGPCPGTHILRLSHEIDLYCAVDLWNMMESMLVEGTRHILVDCSSLAYLDSSGLGVFIRTLQKARTMGIRFALAGLSGAPRKVLHLSSLGSLFTLVADASPGQPFWKN